MSQQPPENRGDDALAEIIRHIVRVAAPERIVLFGSAARREEGPASDLDLLVIKPGRYHRGQLTEEIYLSLIGVGRAVDVVVVTPEDVDRYQDALGLVIAAGAAGGPGRLCRMSAGHRMIRASGSTAPSNLVWAQAMHPGTRVAGQHPSPPPRFCKRSCRVGHDRGEL